MTTQGFITIKQGYKDFDQFIWLNHDAYPEVWKDFFKNKINWEPLKSEKTKPQDILNTITEALKTIDYKKGKNYTIEKDFKNQTMEYKYHIEIYNNEYEIPKIYLRIEEEFWIDETFQPKELKTIEGINYLSSEMRTKELIQLV